MNKKLLALPLALLLANPAAVSAASDRNEWVQSGKDWYYLNENGVMLKNGI